MAETKRMNDQISYKNRKKLNADFAGKDLRRSNCYNCDFTGANFNDASFRGAQFKACTFDEASFEAAEFVAANFKNSRFKNVKFQNTIFDSVNLENTDFEGATFENVIFVATDLTKASHLDLTNQEVQVFEQRPEIELDERLEKAVRSAMTNDYIKYARVLDTKEGHINAISMMLLLDRFDEETLVKGLGMLKRKIKQDFATLSVLIDMLETYESEGLL
ncbi:MAG: pentapeptide repeat-containing protein [Cellulosilyticaceae bacterium]